MTLYREILREEAARALRAAKTLAGPNVFTARSWPLTSFALPAIQLQVLTDTAQSVGRSAPQYLRTAQLVVTAQIEFSTAPQAEILLDAFTEQIENALMLDAALQALVQQVTAIQTELSFDSSNSQQIATAHMRFDLEFTQVYQPSGVPLAAINLAIENAAGETLASAIVPIPQS